MDNTIDNTNQDNDFEKYLLKFYRQLREESVRGSAIVGAALIDDALEQMLKALMIASDQKDDELFNGSYAPLSSLSAKIDIAYRTGLISPKVRASLHIIRKLRNEFAHVSLQINFESQSVHDRIRELFNLNKDLFETLWEMLKDNLDDVKLDDESKHGIDNVVMNLGWKSTYELLISIIAATSLVEKRKIPKIISHHRD